MGRPAAQWGAGTALGVVALLQFGPTVVLSIYAVSLGDRYSKVKILVLTQSLVGALSLVQAFLDVTDRLTSIWVYVLTSVVGLITALDVPAPQAFASELVGPKNIVDAIGLNTASSPSPGFCVPRFAGLMIAGFNTWSIFSVHAISSVAVVASLLRIARAALTRQASPSRAPGQFLAGFRFLRQSPVLVVLVGLASPVAAVGANSLQVLIPLIATERFGSAGLGFGLLSAASAVGGLLASTTRDIASALDLRERGAVRSLPSAGLLQPGLATFALSLAGTCGSGHSRTSTLVAEGPAGLGGGGGRCFWSCAV